MELATGIDRWTPIDPGVFSSLLSAQPTPVTDVLPRLLNSLARGAGCVLILDDVHKLSAPRSVEILEYLAIT